MTELYCENHPDRAAKEKCEKCGKLLCLECINKYRPYFSKDFSSQVYCTECYTVQKQKSNEKMKLLVMGLIIFLVSGLAAILLLFGISGLWMSSQLSSIDWIFIISGIVILGGEAIFILFYLRKTGNLPKFLEKFKRKKLK